MTNPAPSTAEIQKLLEEAKTKQREPDYEKFLQELEKNAAEDLKDEDAHEESYQKYRARWILMFCARHRTFEKEHRIMKEWICKCSTVGEPIHGTALRREATEVLSSLSPNP